MAARGATAHLKIHIHVFAVHDYHILPEGCYEEGLESGARPGFVRDWCVLLVDIFIEFA